MKTIIKYFLLAFTALAIQLNNSDAQLSVSLSTYQPVCNHDGIIVATVQNGTPPYTYTWNGSGVNNVIHNSSLTTDTIYNFSGGYIGITLQDAIGTFASNYILVNFPMTITYTTLADTCPLQTGAVTLNVSGGASPYTYAWTFNGNPFGGNTSTITNLQGGYYDCLVTDNNGCNMFVHELDSFPYGISVYSVNSIATNLTTTPANCTNGTASVNPSGGLAPYTYLWSNGQTTQTITGLFAGSFYTVTVTDMNSCFKNDYAYISSSVSININQSVTPAHCSFSDGAITAIPTGGTSPYSFLWSSGATSNSINNIPAGNYYITVTDLNGCQQSTYINVISLTPVNVSYTTTASQCTTATGSATAIVTGGTTPYTYLWYTSPQQTTSVASNIDAGNYNVIVTDAQGCTRAGTVTIPQNTTLNQSITYTSPICSALNGTASMNASGGTNPLTYLWSNGQTTPTTTNIGTGMIHGTVTDAAGCFVPKSVWIPYYSPMNLNITTNDASCIFTNDGSITAIPSNGTPPYQYYWSDGSTNQTASNLLTGLYEVEVTDANGCNEWSGLIYLGYNTVTPCSGIINGSVFIDLNANCTHGNSEPLLENIPLWCHETNEIHFTNANGQYSFVVPTGNVNIEQLKLPYRFQSCQTGPYVINIPTAGVTIQQDIADTVLFVNDLETHIYDYTQPVVGGDFVQTIVFGNAGTVTLPYTQQYDYDSQCPFSYASTPPSVLNTAQHFCEWNSPAINPLHSFGIFVTHNIPLSVPINTNIFYSDTIFPYNNDTTWWNNYDYDYLTTLGSYDPNYKEVSPKGTGPLGLISQSDSVLEYVIHFQNIGNNYAYNVVVMDTLDSDLDWSSLRVGYSTHQHTTEITPAGILIMHFNNIYLPSIMQDTVASNAFAVYTIHLKSNLADGTQIKNSAGIFFDQNAPVITNTTLNTIKITGVEEQQANANYILFPNPSSGIFNIQFKNNEKAYVIKVKNIIGQEIYSAQHNASKGTNDKIDLSKFSDGFYLLEISDGVNQMNSKIIVRH